MSDFFGTHLPPALAPSGQRFIRHLDALYRFAQALTLDEVRAAELVEETCRRAAALLPNGLREEDEEHRLFELLVATDRDQRAQRTPAPTAADGGGASQPFQRKLAEQFFGRAVPVAVAGLPDDLRAVLLLCDAEGVPCERASGVLGLGEGEARARLEEARAQVRAAVYASATGAERQLLDAEPAGDWLAPSLRRVLRSQLAPAPAALRMSVASIVGTPEAAVAEDGPVGAGPVRRPPLRAAPRRAQTRERGVLVAAVLILTTGLLGLLAARYVRQSADRSLVTLAAKQADRAAVDLRTGQPEEAEAYAQEELGFRLTLPEIEGAVLEGAGIAEVSPDVEVPVFVYLDDTAGEPIVLYAVSYALLDRYGDQVTLDVDVLNQIQNESHFDLHDLGNRQALVFRNRDDIFVAVTRGDAEALRERILFPS